MNIQENNDLNRDRTISGSSTNTINSININNTIDNNNEDEEYVDDGISEENNHRDLELSEFQGLSFCFARSSATIINLNSALILLPVLRNVISWIRGTWINNYVPIDRHISMHKMCAVGLILGSAIHCVAHYVNFEIITNKPYEEVEKYLGNVEFTRMYFMYKSVPGITGHLLVIVLVLIVTSSIERIRRPMFEIFYYTHHLFIVYFVLLCFHGYARMLGKAPQSWLWVIGPMAFYAVERGYRIIRGNRVIMLHIAKQHPSKVLELRFKKENFKYKPGQYLYLNCPYIANHEWHPFTITSGPSEPFISVHINIVGNWTGKIYRLLNPTEKLGIVQTELLEDPDGGPILKIDGPFGAASEDVFKYRTAVLVGAGIGATPFSSILKDIHHRLSQRRQEQIDSGTPVNLPIDKIYFFWISREKNSFEWFTHILRDLENDSVNNFLEIQTYLTGAIEVSDWNAIVEGMATIDTESHSDFITGLKSQTLFGRPSWDKIFPEIARIHPKQDIGVFFCGPHQMAKEIKKNCSKSTGLEGCSFQFYKENF
eukprot:gene6213-7736_t